MQKDKKLKKKPASSTEKTYWLWVLATGLGFLFMAVIQSLVFWGQHTDIFEEIPSNFRQDMPTFVILAVLWFTIVVAIGLRIFFLRYVIPLGQIVEDIEAMEQSSYRARLSTQPHASELVRLEKALNELTHINLDAEKQMENKLVLALSSLKSEKIWLESTLEALHDGVIVCDGDGLVKRYNSAAKRLLSGDYYLGQGRSIYGLIEKPLLFYALESLKEQKTSHLAHPMIQFEIEREQDLLLQICVSPLIRDSVISKGFVLIVENPIYLKKTVRVTPKPKADLDGKGLVTAVDTKEKPLSDLRYVVFDTETTGMNPSKGDEIISIGAVTIVNGKILKNETFAQLVNPCQTISHASSQVHGITSDMVSEMPMIKEVLPHFAQFTEGAILVAHNAAFDMKFLKIKEVEAGITFDQPVLDTMILSEIVHPNQESHSLDTLLWRFGIQISERHTALGDAQMTANLFLCLMPLLKKKGINTLSEAHQASQDSPLSRISF